MYTILIADDEVNTRDNMIDCIDWESLGLHVIALAEDGKTACDLIESLQPDIVLIDIQMPKMNGLEVIHHIRMTLKLPTIFIIMSGYDRFTYAQQALEYQVGRYLLKPFDAAELTSALRYAISLLPPKAEPRPSMQQLPMRNSIYYSIDMEHMLISAINGGMTGTIERACDEFCKKHFSENAQPAERYTSFSLCFSAICRMLLAHNIATIPTSACTERSGEQALLQDLKRLSLEAARMLREARNSNRLISDALTYIDAHFTERLPLSRIAGQVHISPIYLSNLFTEVIGKTITQYIQELRIEMAKNQLTMTQDSITEIAQSIGYTDIKYFTALFKRCTGMTPGAYRKKASVPPE